MELYLKVYRLIEQVSVVHPKPQVKAQRAIIASVSRAGPAVPPKFAQML
jgi:hypothetical protein